MAKMTIFDYAREATEVEEKLLLLLDPPKEQAEEPEETPAVTDGTVAEPAEHNQA